VDKVKKVFHVEGMTCTGCEIRIENNLKKLDGIGEVKAKFADSTVEVNYEENIINEKEIIDKIEILDYKVNIGKRYTKVDNSDNKNKSNILQFIAIIIVLIAIYIIIQNTIGFNFIPEVNTSMGYSALFVIGLLTSLHCVAMCSGINISQCASYKEQNYKSKFTPSLLYNLGRVISYTLIGGIFGAFGSLISISTFTKSMISIISGILMLIMGLNMLNIFPWLRKFNPRMPKFLTNKLNKDKTKKGPLYVGLLNGLMPCGPLQAMQIYALGTGSFINGSISMLLFSLGTVPLMFGLGALSSMLTAKFNHKMMKASATLVIILGIVMMNRGFSLSGISIIPSNIPLLSSSNSINSSNVAVIQNGEQIVTTNLTDGRYVPIVVQKGIPVKWTIKVGQGELNGCNNPISIPKYNITKKLVIGDNLIEFTPTETGNVIYTCWMGMISSSIKVVDDLSTTQPSDLNDIAPSNSGGCCGR
jgi:sulfite exporter TauE/SafE/copper chaperone CopZ